MVVKPFDAMKNIILRASVPERRSNALVLGHNGRDDVLFATDLRERYLNTRSGRLLGFDENESVLM
jgi:hypothetical protein